MVWCVDVDIAVWSRKAAGCVSQKNVKRSKAKSQALKLIFHNVEGVESIRRAVQRAEDQRQREAKDTH